MRRLATFLFSLILLISMILPLAVRKQGIAPGSGVAQGLESKAYLPQVMQNYVSPITLEEPTTLTPAFGPCLETSWYSIPTDRGSSAYLTLNVNSYAYSTNKGEWRPVLPREGFYRVEAYIPAHDPITWCRSSRVRDTDTTEARYRIFHGSGSTLKALSQALLANEWLDLGTYLFKAGTSGYVELGDLNSEADFVSNVSFSAMRFTYQPTHQIALPLIARPSSSSQPYLEVVGGSGQAFDDCNPPTVAAMQNWWTNSPYYSYNLYLGGAAFAVGCSTVSADWVSLVRPQGWTFIPTWVGPQAPCYTHDTAKMNSDPALAYQEGRAEADPAAAAATNLGLVTSALGRTVIYYDLEAYGGSGVSPECRQAVGNFMNGWVQRLHELGHRAGVYGGSCSSNIRDFAFLPNVPDNVWLAYWNKIAAYDPYASVYGILCVEDFRWSNHQRLRQYAGEHTETWGGKSLKIDSNVVDGQVAAPGLPPPLTASGVPLTFSEPTVQALDFLSAGQGWVLAGGKLLWTGDGGQTWQERTQAQFEAVAFLDATQGWAVRDGEIQGTYQIARTTDGGFTWQEARLPQLEGDWQPLQVSFLDDLHGWVAFRAMTSSAFSRGALLKTKDAGKTWQVLDLPIGEKAVFVTPLLGWTAGGAAGEELYRTQDGGLSWQAISLRRSGLDKGSRVNYSLPVFNRAQEGILPVKITLQDGDSQLELYATHDGGANWEPQAVLPWTQAADVDVPLAVLPGLGWAAGTGEKLFAAPSGEVKYLPGGSAPMQQPASSQLPGQISRLGFSTTLDGWAMTLSGTCQGEKSSVDFACRQITELWKTSDGGKTWQAVPLPTPGR